ncbi:MAG: hypothetical protein RR406_00470 [Bacilli bacterium]
MTKPRIKSKTITDKKDETHKQYEIKDVKLNKIITNEKIRNLYYLEKDDVLQKAITEDKLIISHNKAYTHMANIQFEYGNEKVPVVVSNKNSKTVIDAPLVQEEVIYILQKLVTEKSLMGKTHFKSGARFNDETKWKNTGFCFILEYQGFDSNLEKALTKVQEETTYTTKTKDNKTETHELFGFKKYKESEDYETGFQEGYGQRFVIIVNAPVKNDNGRMKEKK